MFVCVHTCNCSITIKHATAGRIICVSSSTFDYNHAKLLGITFCPTGQSGLSVNLVSDATSRFGQPRCGE